METRKRPQPGEKLRAADKVARIPVKIAPTEQPLRKPRWIRAQSQAAQGVQRIKRILREQRLHTVCEEASCPNLGECFAHGTATFMIMGDICTRRCPFCDVAHGRPNPLDPMSPGTWPRRSRPWAWPTWSSPRWTVMTCAMGARRISWPASRPCAG
jgi:lipoyl synthase